MRVFRSQFKIRTLMVVVAVTGALLGVGIGAARLRTRAAYYRGRAAEFGAREAALAQHIRHLAKIAADSERIDNEYTKEARSRTGLERIFLVSGRTLFRGQADRTKKDIARYKAQSAWYGMMKRRYELASLRPWLAVPPEPREPNTIKVDAVER